MPGKKDAGNAVLQEVGDDPGTKASPPEYKRTEHAAVDGDDHSHLPPLIRVRESKQDSLNESAGGGAFCVGAELALQIAAEDGLLADAGGNADQKINGDLCGCVRKQLLHGLILGGVQKKAE